MRQHWKVLSPELVTHTDVDGFLVYFWKVCLKLSYQEIILYLLCFLNIYMIFFFFCFNHLLPWTWCVCGLQMKVSNCCYCPVCTVYSGICTALPRTGGRRANIPVRPRLSMTMWVNLTNPPAVYKYTHIHMLVNTHDHTDRASERRDYLVWDNAAGSCFDTFVSYRLRVCSCWLQPPFVDGARCEPDVWNGVLLKNATPVNTTCIFYGKALRLPSLNF